MLLFAVSMVGTLWVLYRQTGSMVAHIEAEAAVNDQSNAETVARAKSLRLVASQTDGWVAYQNATLGVELKAPKDLGKIEWTSAKDGTDGEALTFSLGSNGAILGGASNRADASSAASAVSKFRKLKNKCSYQRLGQSVTVSCQAITNALNQPAFISYGDPPADAGAVTVGFIDLNVGSGFQTLSLSTQSRDPKYYDTLRLMLSSFRYLDAKS